MNCISECLKGVSFFLEHLGLYEPVLNFDEVKERLLQEHHYWSVYHNDRQAIWDDLQANKPLTTPPPRLVQIAVDRLKERNIHKGVAVDLGCGISSTAFHLLEKGWTVYAVDSSAFVLHRLANRISLMDKNWIQNKRLILVNQSIEEFKYPQKVHLITASDSLPYCDPKEIMKIFLRAKEALFENGIFACNFFSPIEQPLTNEALKIKFGGWTTTKNVIEAVVRSANFPNSPVTLEKKLTVDELHAYAQND